jgi:hypothetical protein
MELQCTFTGPRTLTRMPADVTQGLLHRAHMAYHLAVLQQV